MKAHPANNAAGPSKSPAVGVIRGDELYRLQELQRRMSWGEHATRQARAAGLRLVSFGREKYALGADVLAFFRRLSDLQSDKRPRISAESGVQDANR